MNKFHDLPDGFYWMSGDKEPEPCLVRVYTPSHEPPCRGVGFGVWDGGGFIPLSDLTDDSRFTPVSIVPNIWR